MHRWSFFTSFSSNWGLDTSLLPTPTGIVSRFILGGVVQCDDPVSADEGVIDKKTWLAFLSGLEEKS